MSHLFCFDARQGYWQKRKKEWREAGLKSDAGRDEALIGKGLKKLADVLGLLTALVCVACVLVNGR